MNKNLDDIENINNSDWLREQYQSRSIQSIADELGVARNSIRNRMIKFGIARHSQGELLKGKTLSPEHIAKLSQARTKYWDERPDRDAHKLKVSQAKRKHGAFQGRVRIYVLGKGRILRYRHVAEETLGRKLEAFEQVHHKDENKMNDLPDNLQVLPNSDHQKLHNLTRPRNKKGQFIG